MNLRQSDSSIRDSLNRRHSFQLSPTSFTKLFVKNRQNSNRTAYGDYFDLINRTNDSEPFKP